LSRLSSELRFPSFEDEAKSSNESRSSKNSFTLPMLGPLKSVKVKRVVSSSVVLPSLNCSHHFSRMTYEVYKSCLTRSSGTVQFSESEDTQISSESSFSIQKPKDEELIFKRIFELVDNNQMDACKELLDSEDMQIDEIRTTTGYTLLAHYASKGDIKKVEMLLLDLGADIFAVGSDGLNAFQTVQNELRRLLFLSTYPKLQVTKVQAVEMLLTQFMAICSCDSHIKPDNFKRTT
jgi:hypothetical protein